MGCLDGFGEVRFRTTGSPSIEALGRRILERRAMHSACARCFRHSRGTCRSSWRLPGCQVAHLAGRMTTTVVDPGRSALPLADERASFAPSSSCFGTDHLYAATCSSRWCPPTPTRTAATRLPSRQRSSTASVDADPAGRLGAAVVAVLVPERLLDARARGRLRRPRCPVGRLLMLRPVGRGRPAVAATRRLRRATVGSWNGLLNFGGRSERDRRTRGHRRRPRVARSPPTPRRSAWASRWRRSTTRRRSSNSSPTAPGGRAARRLGSQVRASATAPSRQLSRRRGWN